MIEDETRVLPTATSAPQVRPPPKRYVIAAASTWLGFMSPAPGTTIPWRSASASLPSARSKRSRSSTRRAIAKGDDGSIRILPSQSRVMNPNCGSTASLVTVRSRPYVLADRPPVRDGRTTQRIHAQAQPGPGDRRHVDDVPEIRDVGAHEVVVRGLCTRPLERDASDAGKPVRTLRLQDPVGLVLDPARDIRVGGPAVWRVVLEAAVVGRVVRRRDHDPVGEAGRTPPVGPEDGVRDGGGRREAVGGIDPHVHAVGDEHLEGSPPGGPR